MSEAQRSAEGCVRVGYPGVLRRRPCPTTFRFQLPDDDRAIAEDVKLDVLLLIDFPVEFTSLDQIGQRLEVLVKPSGLILNVSGDVSLTILVGHGTGDFF